MEKDTKLLNPQSIRIKVSEQKLYLTQRNHAVKIYSISTSKFGVGSKSGSNKTPLGLHKVSSKIGKNAPIGAIFIKRRKTGKMAKIRKKASGSATGFNYYSYYALRRVGVRS